MNPLTSIETDIPQSLAFAAHAGTSWVPEERAAQRQREYVATLQADYEGFAKQCDTDDKRVTLDAEFARYREGYKRRYVAYLAAQSRCVSAFIAGPSNFPVRRMEKRNDISHKRLNELVEYRERALKAISKALHPELRPIMSGDADAVQRLQAEIAEAEKRQEMMKECNAVIRRNWKEEKSTQVAALAAVLVDYGVGADAQAKAVKLLSPISPYPPGYASFTLTNNSANIRRMKQRLSVIEKAHATPTQAKESDNGIRMEDCPADNRVRLFFPGKPDEATRSNLKSSGFRWTPSLGCWQAYRNHRSLTIANAYVSAK